jgi:hypothetical protein
MNSGISFVIGLMCILFQAYCLQYLLKVRTSEYSSQIVPKEYIVLQVIALLLACAMTVEASLRVSVEH